MLLAGKKVAIVGGSSGIGLATAELAGREGADVIIASRNVDRLDAVATRLNAIAIPADVTSDDSVNDLFRRCGPVDHVVVTAAQLKTGPFKTVAMEDVRSTMEGKFWGAWRVARAADIRPGGSLTLVSGYLSVRPRPNSPLSAPPTARWSRWRAVSRLSLRRYASTPSRPGSSTPRSAPTCRKRRAATCSPRRQPPCRSAASARVTISRGKSSPS